MQAFATSVDVSLTSAYPATPQVAVTFQPDRFHIKNPSIDTAVLYSFDGTNDAGQVFFGGDKNLGDYVKTQAKSLWLRRAAPSANPITAFVQVTTDR